MNDIDFGAIDVPARREAVSEGRLKFIADLRASWQSAADELAKLTGTPAPRPAWKDPASSREASEMITRGIDARDAKRSELAAARAARPSVTEGMYVIGQIGQPGCRIFKVLRAVRGSGHLYVEEMTDGEFEILRGALAMLARDARRMSLADALLIGELYGTCVRCGRTLTDEESIARGIGPVCAEKI